MKIARGCLFALAVGIGLWLVGLGLVLIVLADLRL